MRAAPVSRYIVVRSIGWLCISLLGAVSIFFVTQMMRAAPILMGGDFLCILRMLLYIAAPVVAFALVPAFFIALFAVAGRMNETGELTAVDALGLSRRRIQAHLLLFAFLLFAVDAALSLVAAPYALKQARTEARAMLRTSIIGQLHSGQFNRLTPEFVFYFENRTAPNSFSRIFAEHTTKESRIEVVANQTDIRITPSFDIAFRFSEGRAFITAKGEVKSKSDDDAPRISVAFKDFTLTVPLESEEIAIADFIPKELSVSTFELLTAPGLHSDTAGQFALWRRIAAPVGFFAAALFCVLIAFGGASFRRTRGIWSAALMFLLFHLVGRLGETLALDRTLPPGIAALMPTLVYATGSFIAVLSGTAIYRRFRTLRIKPGLRNPGALI